MKVVLVLLLLAFSISHCNCYKEEEITDIFNMWDDVVSRSVKPGVLQNTSLNVVDYIGISKNTNYTGFIDGIAKVNTSGFDKNMTYAFFMNVYNALAIKMIIDHPCSSSCQPIKGIRDIGSLLHPVWKRPAGFVAGRNWSLDAVELYLRNPLPFDEDPRLHACIVCASISCPNLRMEAFRPDTVDQQMDQQMRDFLMNDKKGLSLDTQSNTLHLSPIFLWFVLDFEPYGGVMNFISPYLTKSQSQYISHNKPTIQYFSYNWDVNGTPPCKC